MRREERHGRARSVPWLHRCKPPGTAGVGHTRFKMIRGALDHRLVQRSAASSSQHPMAQGFPGPASPLSGAVGMRGTGPRQAACCHHQVASAGGSPPAAPRSAARLRLPVRPSLPCLSERRVANEHGDTHGQAGVK